MWLDGTPHWDATQMDSISLPILLADKLRLEDALDGFDPRPLMHAATCFLLRHGPVTEQDRWEAVGGYSPYTMAVQVSALLAGAVCAEQRGAPDEAEFLRETADAWNDAIDELTYVRDTELARKHGVGGYYLRITPPQRIEKAKTGRPADSYSEPAARQGSSTRGGYRQPGCACAGPIWTACGERSADARQREGHRCDAEAGHAHGTDVGAFDDDGYGEHADGRPFSKTGIGRGWPLLAGERGPL